MINEIILIPIDAKTIFCTRLKAARKMAGISQKNLGIKAGLDEFVASTRINRYELGIHEVDIGMAARMVKVLNVPLAYFYATEEELADIILEYAKHRSIGYSSSL